MFIRAHLTQILFFFVILFIMLIKMYSIADLLGRVLIVGSILFSFISYFIVKSAIMHTFIEHLNDTGVTDSIYWTVLIIIIPILTTLIRPLINILDNKSPLVQFLALFSFIVFILFILLIYMANIAYNIFGI